MRHGSSCYDMLSAVPLGIAYLRSVAFVRRHGCFLLSQMAVFQAHGFFSDSGIFDRTTDRRSFFGSVFLESGERRSRGKRVTMTRQVLVRSI